ncbi:unnamed protein product, partial [Staurois parvus]
IPYIHYIAKCIGIGPNLDGWVNVFQSPPWPQVYKIKHLGMQTASTNICERMGCSQELSEFNRSTVIGCHLCNKSIHDILLLLKIPRSTVRGIITKWKQLGTTATQPQSGRPHKMTELDQLMLKRIVCRSRQLSAESIAKDLLHVAFRLAQQQCVESFMERVSMAEQLHPSLISPSAMQSVRCRGINHVATGLQ